MTYNIKLPPMPEWAKMDNLDCMSPSEIRTALNEFGREAVRLNAQADAKPMFWVRLCSDGCYEGPIHDSSIEDVRKQSGVWHPLYLAAPAAPQPAQQPLTATQKQNAKRWRWAFVESPDWTYAVCKWDGSDWLPINTSDDVAELDSAIEQAHGIGVKND